MYTNNMLITTIICIVSLAVYFCFRFNLFKMRNQNTSRQWGIVSLFFAAFGFIGTILLYLWKL